MYDGIKAWRDIAAGTPTAEAVDGALFHIYTRAEQTQPLFHYIDAARESERPLMLGALDVPQAGRHARTELLPELAALLRAQGWQDLLDDGRWPDFLAIAEATIAMQPVDANLRPALAGFDALYTELLARLSERRLETGVGGETGLWLQLLRSLRTSQLEMANQCTRDSQMAENVLWLAEHLHPGRRIVIWAHSMRCLPTRQYSMGDLIKQLYGRDAYIAWFTGHGGAALHYDSKQAFPLPAPPAQSWEAAWQAGGQRCGFFDLRAPAADSEADALLRNPLSIRTVAYADDHTHGADLLGPAPGDMPKIDGVFYLDQIEPVRLR